ncbi:MAG: hypothetical protein II350_08440 [Clostridia bacterium]|nr:hypothetical protein [Clostridia bacterium]
MDFRNEYLSAMSRLGVFRTSEEFEVQKTVAAIDTLLRRADDLHRGAIPHPCFGIDVDNLLIRAEAHLSALERGERPLAGKFTEPGVAFVDHCFIEHEGIMHVFYNRSWVGYDWPERFTDTIGHATSTDLIHWDIHTPVLAVSPNDFGTYQVWSPSVIEDSGKFYMLYTGVNENVAQAACLAVSDDLYHFEKYPQIPSMYPVRGATGMHPAGLTAETAFVSNTMGFSTSTYTSQSLRQTVQTHLPQALFLPRI